MKLLTPVGKLRTARERMPEAWLSWIDWAVELSWVASGWDRSKLARFLAGFFELPRNLASGWGACSCTANQLRLLALMLWLVPIRQLRFFLARRCKAKQAYLWQITPKLIIHRNPTYSHNHT